MTLFDSVLGSSSTKSVRMSMRYDGDDVPDELRRWIFTFRVSPLPPGDPAQRNTASVGPLKRPFSPLLVSLLSHSSMREPANT